MSCDRQTDKATWWSITAFEETERAMLAGDTFPPFVVRVYGGLEECPDTGRIHFQGAVQCKGQQRFSAIKKWLPKAHIEAARSADALKKYAMKEETAVDEKKVVENRSAYIDNQAALMLLAEEKIDYGISRIADELSESIDKIPEREFELLANRIVYRAPVLVGVFSKPDVMRGWRMFRGTFLRLAEDRRADSITARPKNEIVDPAGDLKEVETKLFVDGVTGAPAPPTVDEE